MSLHNDWIRLQHMYDSSREVLTLVQGRARYDLDRDRLLNLSVVRLLEMVGEAAGRISVSFREAHPEIPWAQIVGLRNRLIHGYDDVDFEILWRIVTSDLPFLVGVLEQILSSQRD